MRAAAHIEPRALRRRFAVVVALAAIGFCGAARAFVTVDVDPMTAAVGQPVSVFGSSNCESVIVDFGDGSPTAGFPGPGPFATTHVYTTPGVRLVTALASACPDPIDSQVSTVVVNPAGGGPGPATPSGGLVIERLRLVFDNNRSETRVPQHHSGLQAFAQIQYAGTGLLQGFFEVDGAVWSYVNRHLVFGRNVVIASPALPGLPTLNPGVHRLRFVLTRPALGATPPEALYFVGVDSARVLAPMRLIEPERDARVAYEARRFTWSAAPGAASYHVALFEADGTEPIFTAFAKEPAYALPEAVIGSRFAPGREYAWQVTGYDDAGSTVAQSPRQRFAFAPLEEYVPRQLVVATQFSLAGTQVLARLKARYGLREVQSYRLRSLDWQVTVLETSENVPAMVRTLAGEEGVLLVQPNFILRTLTEPQSRLQRLDQLLNFEVLHRAARGRGMRVAVIDTGIDTAHADLRDRIALARDLAGREFRGAEAGEIHGTAVAGVIAASRNGFGIVGVAPEARLLALRACRQVKPDHPRARCESADVARALDVAFTEKAQIVNMSFGLDRPVPLIARLLEHGAKAGVWFVAPVGNAPWQEEVAFPARHHAVIAVAGIDEHGRAYPNALLRERSRALAPATNLFSTVPGGRHNFLSGTSLSSAVVTGLIALALEARALAPADLPARDADVCVWAARLLELPLCERAPEPRSALDPRR